MAPTTRGATAIPTLDSSPVALPPARPRPLKRSASLASLPTPPRTLTRKKSLKSKSRAPASETESDYSQASDGEDGVQEADRVVIGRKKRRTAVALKGHDDDEGSENEFWMGGAGASTSPKASKSPKSKSKAKAKKTVHIDEAEGDSPPALLSYRVRAPMSPPPSHRKKATTVPKTPTTATPSLEAPFTPTKTGPPATPESAGPSTRSRTRRALAVRDSPENPFLVSSGESSGSPMSMGPKKSPRTPQRHEEKPFMTYVFRGMKAQFDNPMYNLPPSVHERSLLPIEHPDYEAEEACAPRLLFPSAHRRSKRLHTIPESEPQLRTPTQKVPQATQGLSAGAVIIEKADVGTRARGPVRRK